MIISEKGDARGAGVYFGRNDVPEVSRRTLV